MNCDPLARSYRLIEFAAFGSRLEKHRFHFLDQLKDARRALVLGEGDGRFLARFLAVNPDVQVDCLDASARMLELARRRTAENARVRFHQADARLHRFETGTYDLVVSNFFLDCFDDAEAAALIHSIAAACQPGASLLVSEFHQPKSGWRARHAALWLAAMYTFFRLTTGLRVGRLPDFRPVLSECGFERLAAMRSFGQLVTSELWRRSR